MLESNRTYLGDCLQVMKEIPDRSIDLILTDPPYKLNNMGGGKTSLGPIEKIKHGLTDIQNSFDIQNTLNEFKRICKKFNAFLFCSNSQISEIMKWGEDNKYSTTCLVWHKYNATPFCNGTWKSDIEFIIHIREKNATFKGNASLKSKVTSIPTVVSKFQHPTEKPLDLIEKFIKIGSNESDLILDPFIGSGTTAVGCINQKRNFIGIEKEQKYYDVANKRIADVKSQIKLAI